MVHRQKFEVGILPLIEKITESDTLQPLDSKEGYNRGVACSLLKLGSLEKTIIASLFHSGLHSGSI